MRSFYETSVEERLQVGLRKSVGAGNLVLKLFNLRKEDRMYFPTSFGFLSLPKLEGDGVYLSHSA